MLKPRIFFSVFVLFSLTRCAHQLPSTQQDLVPITILHTNDVHAHAWPFGAPPQKGGLAAQAALVEKIRKESAEKGGIVLLLSAGDVNTGVPESDFQQAEPDFHAMNSMHYDAMVLGNHEFDKGMQQIEMQKKRARFPILSANVSYKDKNKQPLAEPYAVIEKNGVKFGIIGLTTDNLPYLMPPQYLKDLVIENPVPRAKALAQTIQADIVIALTHLGVSETAVNDKERAYHFDNDIAEAVPEIPIIIGGHSHTLLPKGFRHKNTLIAQAGSFGEYIGRVDLVWSRKNHRIASTQASVIQVSAHEQENPQLKAELDAMKERVASKYTEVIGTASVRLTGGKGYNTQENALGNLMCDALRERAKTDVAIFNSGGIRTFIEKGPIQIRNVFEAFPFSNTLIKVELSGKELRKVLEQSLQERHHSGSFLQVSGISYRFQGDKLLSARILNQPLSDSKTYTLATNSFLSGGGDGITSLVPLKKTDLGVLVSEVLMQYIRKLQTVTFTKQNRILSP